MARTGSATDADASTPQARTLRDARCAEKRTCVILVWVLPATVCRLRQARAGRLGEGRPLAAPEQAAASASRARSARRSVPMPSFVRSKRLSSPPACARSAIGELKDQIDEVRACLRRAGFDASARIAVAIPNTCQAALAIVAAACSAVAVPLDPKLTLPEIEARLILLRPSAVLLPRGSRRRPAPPPSNKASRSSRRVAADDGKLGLRLVAPQVGPALPLHDPDPDAPAFILQTSGTTADPNLVPFSHRNMLAAAKRLQAGSRSSRRIAACAHRRSAIPTASR